MQQRPSVVEEQAIDPFLAGLALEQLRGRVQEAWAGALAALLAAAALMALGRPGMAGAVACGSLAGVVLAVLARGDRVALVERLVRQRSAYAIDEVARRGEDLVSRSARERIAATIETLVAQADDADAAPPGRLVCDERVREVRGELLELAAHLADPATRVHPSAVALAERLLAATRLSPLYEERLPAEQVRLALRRIALGITPHATDA